ncbi:DUF4232 domain-containing protein [Corynebacterium sp. YSMAA1_1_F7]|uniref:DUF4232 domain-containing protein n=1 Tax=Corynebacterium sp. YSMAA1_1_F7 TaxID=3383590 RepID=UPI0038D068BA
MMSLRRHPATPRSRAPRSTFAAGATALLLAGTALTLSACEDDGAAPTEAASTESTSSEDTSAQTLADRDTASTGSTGSKTDDGAVDKGGMCATNDLEITTTGLQGAAGSTLVNVVFENTSSTPCSMRGFPGVSMVTNHNGTQLGKPAQREDGVPSKTVKLDPGASAIAGVKITKTGVLDPQECKSQKADGLRVYPPEQTKAAYVPMKNLEGCSGDVEYLSVQPVGLDNRGDDKAGQ